MNNYDLPDWVQEAEAALASGETIPGPENKEEVTIKFGKGLVGEPFMSKAGKELVEVKVPNQDKNDSRSWESFVVPKNFLHENKYGKGIWMKLPSNGTTNLTRPVRSVSESGEASWKEEKRVVSNKDLKKMLESYKNKDRKEPER